MGRTSPIVVLDSGLGGLTVVRALQRQSPGENILYFGDTARVPYGCKSAQTVTLFVREIITYLLRYEPKHVVIACNTATALAMAALQEEFHHLPMSGVIEPGARAAVSAAGELNLSPTIAVIATEATVNSGAYPRAILQLQPHARVLARATPLLVPIIEDGRNDFDPLVSLALEQYLGPIKQQQPQVLVLGCTHYPIFGPMISRLMGSTCRVIDSAEQCAQDVTRRLRMSGTLARSGSIGSLECFVTDDPGKFRLLAGQFLGKQIGGLTRLLPEQLAIPLKDSGGLLHLAGDDRRDQKVPLRAAV